MTNALTLLLLLLFHVPGCDGYEPNDGYAQECYNNKCVGNGTAADPDIDCNQPNNICGFNNKGVRKCSPNFGGRPSGGVFCPSDFFNKCSCTYPDALAECLCKMKMSGIVVLTVLGLLGAVLIVCGFCVLKWYLHKKEVVRAHLEMREREVVLSSDSGTGLRPIPRSRVVSYTDNSCGKSKLLSENGNSVSDKPAASTLHPVAAPRGRSKSPMHRAKSPAKSPMTARSPMPKSPRKVRAKSPAPGYLKEDTAREPLVNSYQLQVNIPIIDIE